MRYTPLAQLAAVDRLRWATLYIDSGAPAPGVDTETNAQAAELLGHPEVAQAIRIHGFQAENVIRDGDWPDMRQRQDAEVFPSMAAVKAADRLRGYAKDIDLTNPASPLVVRLHHMRAGREERQGWVDALRWAADIIEQEAHEEETAHVD